ncbi:DoxX family protein [Nocardia sp. ET3-3]|uniref:DoxX family protein n=1 Tax=Nocardia terrae TaxID=2675851 RepID=A0A7K1V236_9NOCA|nr:DoxX family protein [Nocardia terrae]MVU80674.1 DoxX family protein [Nocardia terrae]
MNALLWTLQIVLALGFAAAGATKIILPRDQLATTLGNWVEDFPALLLKPLGAAEVLGAIALVIPPAIDVAPILTPIAAVCLVITMIGALVTHVRKGEYSKLVVNVLLAVMAIVVAWGRFGPYSSY